MWTLLAALTIPFSPFGLGPAPPKQLLQQQTSPATTTLIPELSFNPRFQTFHSLLAQPTTSWLALLARPIPIRLLLAENLSSTSAITTAKIHRRQSLQSRRQPQPPAGRHSH